jgi:hypothetical protein
MAERELPKLETGVRFPSSAPINPHRRLRSRRSPAPRRSRWSVCRRCRRRCLRGPLGHRHRHRHRHRSGRQGELLEAGTAAALLADRLRRAEPASVESLHPEEMVGHHRLEVTAASLRRASHPASLLLRRPLPAPPPDRSDRPALPTRRRGIPEPQERPRGKNQEPCLLGVPQTRPGAESPRSRSVQAGASPESLRGWFSARGEEASASPRRMRTTRARQTSSGCA